MILSFFEKVTDRLLGVLDKVLFKVYLVGNKVCEMLEGDKVIRSGPFKNPQNSIVESNVAPINKDDFVNSFTEYQGMEVTLLKLELATYYPSNIERVFYHIESDQIFVVNTSLDKDGEMFIYLGEL